MGLLVSVFRSVGADCTNGGLSSHADVVTVINVDGPFEPTPEAPGVVLTAGNMAGTAILVPPGIQTRHVMFGGNYAATSDSRFTRAVEAYAGHRFYGAIPIHDRFE